jgi:small GTP-binding protein
MRATKTILVGDAQVGKSTLSLHLLQNRVSTKRYCPTLGTEVHPITIKQSRFNFWDTAGDEHFGGLRTGYYIQGELCIHMYNNAELQEKHTWDEDVLSVCPNIPIVRLVNVFDTLPLPPNEPNKNLLYVRLSTGEGVEQFKDFLQRLASV